MLVLTFAVGALDYERWALPVLEHYFASRDLRFVVHREGRDHPAHPSWYKLLAHKLYPEEDFILCWDLDLLPARATVEMDYIASGLLNLSLDTSLFYGQPRERNDFFYNCGLLGIPRCLGGAMADLFDACAPGDRPSWEQYYVNEWIARSDVGVYALPVRMNVLHPLFGQSPTLWQQARFQHYTYGVTAVNRAELIRLHHDRYFLEHGLVSHRLALPNAAPGQI